MLQDEIKSDDPRKTHKLSTISLAKHTENKIRYFNFLAQNSGQSVVIATNSSKLRSFNISPTAKIGFENDFFISLIYSKTQSANI